MITNNAQETLTFGKELGNKLPKGAILSFHGDLGAGKTTFIKGIASGVTGCSPDEVTSPTFTLLNIHKGPSGVLYHFDLYRLHEEEEFFTMGFDEYLEIGAVCCIEWPERIPSLMKESIKVTLTPLSEEKREIIVEGINL